MQTIDEGIFYEHCYPGVTVGAITLPHGIIMIDAPLRLEDIRGWRSALHSRGGGERLLVSLDAHPDRTLGVRLMESTVVAHQKTASALKKRSSIFKGQSDENGAEWELCTPLGSRRWGHPDITFSSQLTLHWGESTVHIAHYPGPMPGACWVSVPEAKVVFVGDAVLKDQPPFLGDANIPRWVESLEALSSEAYQGYTIISGRGGPVAAQDVEAQRLLLERIHEELTNLLEKGAPAKAARALAADLLEEIPYPARRKGFYTLRLEYGLEACYKQNYLKSEKHKK
ncbi:MAG: hypothetical protein D6755_11120 [Anaerolineae bacterium]|nr:MAG: hypothetical protein D6755_11120 [Anaerolineae bacterium]